MSSDSDPGSGGRLLEWWSSGEEGVLQFGSAADSCKKVGSGAFIVGAIDHSYLMILPHLRLIMPLYPPLCRRAPHHARRPCNEACVCRWGVPTLPVSGRLYDHGRPPYVRLVTCVGSATSAGQLSEGVMT
ncbi:hypothetical protein BHM03_00028291 [Ensete ventricosum]|nr:hypothetical protein BHM03_00028291 [Ensete ventricosum]